MTNRIRAIASLRWAKSDKILFLFSSKAVQQQLIKKLQMTTEFIEQQSELELAVGLWQPGRYVWKLEDIRQLANPILTKGKQGLWSVSLDLRQKLTELDQVQLPAASR